MNLVSFSVPFFIPFCFIDAAGGEGNDNQSTVVTKTWNGTEFARNIPCTQNME